MAGAIGLPLARSHTTVVSRWLVIPIAAMSRGSTFALAIAASITAHCDDQISCGFVLDPSGLREELPEFLLRDADAVAGMIEDDRTRTRRALVERENKGHPVPRN
jgi:hypothetical protein